MLPSAVTKLTCCRHAILFLSDEKVFNPVCSFEVGRKKCPHQCPLCKAVMGPVKAKDPKPKPEKEKAVVKHPTIELEPGLYSVQYHQHNRLDIL